MQLAGLDHHGGPSMTFSCLVANAVNTSNGWYSNEEVCQRQGHPHKVEPLG